MQEEISLPISLPSGQVRWTRPEREYYSDIFQTEVVTNVAEPRLIAFRSANPTGTSVVVCPGGGFHALSINSEGRDLAEWLCPKGVTVFVLKYRTVPSKGPDAVQELVATIGNREKLDEVNAPVVPLSLSDGLEAIDYVRTHAGDIGIDAHRVGILGFSAGGAVAAHAAIHHSAENRPDFVAPIYAYMGAVPHGNVPADAPPLFALAASDDPLGLARDSVELYSRWLAAGKSAELHLYSQGGHGFGMRKQNLPSDDWIERFAAWLQHQGF